MLLWAKRSFSAMQFSPYWTDILLKISDVLLASADHLKQITASCSEIACYEPGATIFKEALQTNAALIKPDIESS
jgi:hypothetical protein